MTLSEFLLARITELEAVAREAIAPSWGGAGRDFYSTVGPHADDWGLYTFHVPLARVLAECEAERRIVDAARAEYEDSLQSGDDTTSLAKEVLHALALPHSDHPDYDEAWRP
ncbi:DUF6221 family protein [Oerskovia paurometabola]|uniref:DUF6221 family protein n=1 Tax=Oerskovia paurometabola TaxID=162170 RepID=UPI00343C0341